MSSDWTRTTLSQASVKIADRDHFTPTYVEHGVPMISPKDFDESGRLDFSRCQYITQAAHLRNRRKTDINAGDIVFTRIGARLGKAALVTVNMPEFSLLHSAVMIRPDLSSVVSEYLLYVMKGQELQSQIGREIQSIGVPDLGLDKINAFEITLPPLPEQRKIARILTTLDELIEKTEALIAKYQAIKQGMMHDLFTRGVDEHGQLRPTYDEAPELYKESELGWIPKEWDCGELKAVVPRAEYGISVSLDDGDGIPVLRMNNLYGGKIDVVDIKRSRSTEARQLLLVNRDVLFNRTNSIEHVGRTSIWREELPVASFASYLVRLIPDYDQLLPEYLVLWLNLPKTQIVIRQFATPGVHQVNINPTNLRRTPIALPERIEEQQRICDVVLQHDEVIDNEAAYLDKLRLKKTGLMQDLLIGKVRVKPDEAGGPP